MTSSWRPEEPGSLTEEAARLAEAVEDWARRRTDGSGSAFSALLGEHVATGAPECQLCPVCKLIAALRGVSPETLDHVLDAVGSLSEALRSVAADAAGPRSERRASGVEHIDVQDG